MKSVENIIEDEGEGDIHNIPLYKKSKFYQRYNQMLENLEPISSRSTNLFRDKNMLYNQIILDVALKKYTPYLPLWANVVPQQENTSTERFSNAPVENWFRKVKNNILRNSGPKLRCSRFLRLIREAVTASGRECTLNIDKKGCAMGKKNKRQIEIGSGNRKEPKRHISPVKKLNI